MASKHRGLPPLMLGGLASTVLGLAHGQSPHVTLWPPLVTKVIENRVPAVLAFTVALVTHSPSPSVRVVGAKDPWPPRQGVVVVPYLTCMPLSHGLWPNVMAVIREVPLLLKAASA